MGTELIFDFFLFSAWPILSSVEFDITKRGKICLIIGE